ncbi:MAG TPA: hypothetical protein VF469_09995 [Kofleriaceae bacterium]
MIREQGTEQEAQQSDAGLDARSADDVQGLPPRIHQQVMAIKPGPGAAEALADLMDAFDGVFAQRVAAVAARAPQLGNALVQDAIKISQAHASSRSAAPGHAPAHAPAPGSANAFDKEEFRQDTAKDGATDDDNLSGLDGKQRESLPPEVRAQVMAMRPGEAAKLAQLLSRHPGDMHGILMLARTHLGVSTVAEAVQMKQQGGSAASPAAPEGVPAKPEHHAAWVVSAQAYNAAHADLVEEFNELTDDRCRLDGDSKVDVHAVSRWQAHHGLDADGKIGPHTIARARAVQAKPSQVAAAPAPDARIPV